MWKVLLLVCSAISLAQAAGRYPQANSPAYYGFSPDYTPKQRYSGPLLQRASYAVPHSTPYVHAQPSYHEPAYEAKPSPYSFGYKVNDGYGNQNYQNEEGDDYGTKKGSYGYTDAYGIYRKVDYIADAYGFRANVYTNEPGTANQAPADTKWQSVAEPNVQYAASAHAPSTYIAPSSHAAAPSPYVAPIEAYKIPSSAYYPPSRGYARRY